MGAHKETVETLTLNLVFFYAETDLLGLFILMELGETTECCGLNKTAVNLCKYESSKGHHCGIYIFIQKKPMIRPVLMLLLWSLYRSLVCFRFPISPFKLSFVCFTQVDH